MKKKDKELLIILSPVLTGIVVFSLMALL